MDFDPVDVAAQWVQQSHTESTLSASALPLVHHRPPSPCGARRSEKEPFDEFPVSVLEAALVKAEAEGFENIWLNGPPCMEQHMQVLQRLAPASAKYIAIKGVIVTEALIAAIVSRCPALETFSMEACTGAPSMAAALAPFSNSRLEGLIYNHGTDTAGVVQAACAVRTLVNLNVGQSEDPTLPLEEICAFMGCAPPTLRQIEVGPFWDHSEREAQFALLRARLFADEALWPLRTIDDVYSDEAQADTELVVASCGDDMYAGKADKVLGVKY